MTATFDPPRVFTGNAEDWLVLGVLVSAAVLGQLFLVVRNRHPDNVHSPPLAWLRALLYFAVILVISWATGVLGVLVHGPCVLPGQASDPLWLGLTLLWAAVTVWGYVYWWPRGTLTHGRKLYPVTQGLFGLAWGFTSAQLTLVLWALVEDFGFARWVTALLVFFLLSGYGQVYQSGWWDIHVSPPHNIRSTNAKKVLFAHMPFLLVGLTHFVLFGNALVFAGFHGLALACSAVAMRFPPFWAPDGPVVNRDTALG
ncbi:MAG: hypothetical protein J0M16_02565 [Gammaproteobacteria bacterium]|jgi:hypothetical protein|nr:hypothetical protein [Gammaproteobacteria bacterium]